MITRYILYFFAFLAFCYIMGMIYNISQYFKQKANYQMIINTNETNVKTKMTMTERVDITLSIMNLLNVLIDNEINKTLQACARINTKYDVTRLDKDVKIIATTVFEAIKPEVFISADSIISDNFLMQHITDEVMIRLMKVGQEYNKALQQLQ